MTGNRRAQEDETKWRQFLQQHPNSVDAAIGLSSALEKQDDVTGATQVLKEANERVPNNESITTQLTRLESASKK